MSSASQVNSSPNQTAAAASAAPSPIGPNGAQAADATQQARGKDRDSHGRFSEGNKGGPGNPFGRQVAALRAGLLRRVSQQDIDDVMAALLVKAKSGDVAAARLFLSYTVGKPAATVEPDRVDIDEWQLVKQTTAHPEDVLNSVRRMPIDMATRLAQATQPALGEGMARKLRAGLKALDRVDQRRAERKRRKAERKQARLARWHEGEAGAAPSPNGNGRPPEDGTTNQAPSAKRPDNAAPSPNGNLR